MEKFKSSFEGELVKYHGLFFLQRGASAKIDYIEEIIFWMKMVSFSSIFIMSLHCLMGD